MAPRSPSPPPRRRSPRPSSSRDHHDRRSRSPVARSSRYDDRSGGKRQSRGYDDDRYDRKDRRDTDDNKYDRRREHERRRSRSPHGRPREGGNRNEARDNGKDRDRQQEGGDGGRGKRAGSPGRPSQALPSQQSLTRKEGEDAPAKPVEPNFKQSGALAAETNTLRGVVLKYNEPPEARKPVRNWRLYVFKGKEQVELFHVHRQSAYLVGRDRIVADIPIDHPSSSKQHAVLQFRQVTERNEFGDTKSLTKPFIIDLDSANGTMVNDEAVPASRFYELKSGDVLKFAFSTRDGPIDSPNLHKILKACFFVSLSLVGLLSTAEVEHLWHEHPDRYDLKAGTFLKYTFTGLFMGCGVTSQMLYQPCAALFGQPSEFATCYRLNTASAILEWGSCFALSGFMATLALDVWPLSRHVPVHPRFSATSQGLSHVHDQDDKIEIPASIEASGDEKVVEGDDIVFAEALSFESA
ncbi:Pml1p [Sporobolomyces koalae]|uniref:Pml1p n=1 Tax=Sporobolomyces koalae TaxID=500713 RepID=UPI0031828C26